jgi:membrane fusion protein
MTASIFREEAIAHQQERLWGEVIISRPTSYVVLTALIAVGTAIAFCYLLANDYTRRESVIGVLVPTKGIVSVFAPQPGLLSELYAREGDVVAKGSELFKVQIDQKMTAENYISQQILQELAEQRHTLGTAIQLEHESLASLLARQEISTRKLEHELVSLLAQIETQTALSQIENAAFARARELLAKHAISKADMDNVEKNFLGNQQQLHSLQASLDDKKFELEEIRNMRGDYQIDNRKKVAELRNRISEISSQIARAEVEQSNIIRAPVAGTVATLTPSLGQKVDATAPVITIIPGESELEAHLYVPTSAIGFIQAGQKVNLRYEAFPYQRFGLFVGSVSHVTNSVLSQSEVPALLPVKEPVYRITATLARQTVSAYGENIMLKPGMLLAADIELEQRSLLEWLLAPLYSLRGKL